MPEYSLEEQEKDLRKIDDEIYKMIVSVRHTVAKHIQTQIEQDIKNKLYISIENILKGEE